MLLERLANATNLERLTLDLAKIPLNGNIAIPNLLNNTPKLKKLKLQGIEFVNGANVVTVFYDLVNHKTIESL